MSWPEFEARVAELTAEFRGDREVVDPEAYARYVAMIEHVTGKLAPPPPRLPRWQVTHQDADTDLVDVAAGWEPFAVVRSYPAMVTQIWLRRQITP